MKVLSLNNQGGGGGGSGTPGGSTTQVQFNNAGAFGGDADLTWNSVTNVLSVTGSVQTVDGITFPATAVANADPNTLDDYEEGTWTPTQGGGLTVVGTFSSAGHYIKVGRQVTIQGYVAGSTTVAATANSVLCAGLPFQVMNVSGSHFIGSASNGSLSALMNVWINQISFTMYAVTSMAATTGIYFTASYFTA
jgi:hypothetical protein